MKDINVEIVEANHHNFKNFLEAIKIELMAGTLVNAVKSTDPNTINSISIANLLKGVEKSYEKGKYLLDDFK